MSTTRRSTSQPPSQSFDYFCNTKLRESSDIASLLIKIFNLKKFRNDLFFRLNKIIYLCSQSLTIQEHLEILLL